MNTKFTIKQFALISSIVILFMVPWYGLYLKLDMNSQIWFLIWLIICLSIAWYFCYILINDLFPEKNFDKNKYDDTSNLKNIDKPVSINDRIWLIHRLRCLSPCCFECLLEKIFEFKWYEIVKSPSYLWDKPQADNGYDLIVKKDDENIYVQIKKNIANYIKDKQIKEFKWTILKNKWIYITTSVYSPNAKRYAGKVGIRLVDYNGLLKEIDNLKPEEKEQIEKFVNDKSNLWDAKYLPKTCKKCWAPMKSWKFSYYCLNRYENIKCCNKEYIS